MPAKIFQLLGKQQLLDFNSVAKLSVIDAPKTPIERPKQGRSAWLQWKQEATSPQNSISGKPKNFGSDLNHVCYWQRTRLSPVST